MYCARGPNDRSYQMIPDGSQPLQGPPDDRIIGRCEDIPEHPDPGNYVVIDVAFFSTTVVELLARGATHVHVTARRGDEFAYRAANPRARIGGGNTAAYEPTDGYDFFNSPSYVHSVDVEGRPVSMTSTNGGRAVNALLDAAADGVDVYVGSTTNAAALARWLRRDDRPTCLVSAGSSGESATEDLVGAVLIGRFLDETPPSSVELDLFRELLVRAKGATHERRLSDMAHVTAVNSRTVVPRLEGRRFVNLATPAQVPSGAD